MGKLILLLSVLCLSLVSKAQVLHDCEIGGLVVDLNDPWFSAKENEDKPISEIPADKFLKLRLLVLEVGTGNVSDMQGRILFSDKYSVTAASKSTVTSRTEKASQVAKGIFDILKVFSPDIYEIETLSFGPSSQMGVAATLLVLKDINGTVLDTVGYAFGALGFGSCSTGQVSFFPMP